VTNLYHEAAALLGQEASFAAILNLPRYLPCEGTSHTGKPKNG
jgi:hypothetical protein